MTIWGIITLVLGSNVTVKLIEAVIAHFTKKAEKKAGKKDRIDELSDKVDKLIAHDKENYLSILRLTIMSDSMPMSERLIAGQTYVDNGGNGDVKEYFKRMKAECDGKKAE